jgi:hypothetical protein
LGQLPDDVDDMGDAAVVLFGHNGPPTIDLDEPAPAPAPAASNASLASSNTSTGSKRKSPWWQDFTEVVDVVDGVSMVMAVCNMCKSKLTARSAVGTGHLHRHCDSCKKRQNMLKWFKLGLH